jgi:hypothetical protein
LFFATRYAEHCELVEKALATLAEGHFESDFRSQWRSDRPTKDVLTRPKLAETHLFAAFRYVVLPIASLADNVARLCFSAVEFVFDGALLALRVVLFSSIHDVEYSHSKPLRP